MPQKKNGPSLFGKNEKLKKSIGFTILFIITLSLLVIPTYPGVSHADQPRGTLLCDRFGVNLTLLPPHDGVPYPSFDRDSFHPTCNNNSVQYTIRDWYGNWDTTSWTVSTVWGDTPSGGEWYDVEAIYFDINATHLFIIVITSFPFYEQQYDGDWGVGIKEPRWAMPNNWVRPGDLCLDLNLGSPRVERYGAWNYDYGIDLIHENRDDKYPLNYGNTYMRDNNLGSALYKTIADPGGQSVQDPGYGYDWYTASWYSIANWKHTNFDPFSVLSSSTLEKMGDETDGIITDYYQYEFTGEWTGYEENNADTWIIEATIPIHLFKEGDWPPPGGTMGIQWISSCRNDAPVAASLNVTLPVQLGDLVWEDLDADGIQDVGEPGVGGVTVNLLDESSVVIDSVVTDEMGGYLFSGLSPGEYAVEVVAPEGFLFTGRDVGGDDAVDSDVDPVSGVSGMVMLSSGMIDVTVDAGVYRFASVGDLVWEDLDADGIQDPIEQGLEDIAVSLYNTNGTLLGTTQTNSTGWYGFMNIPPGNYYLGFILPPEHSYSPPDKGNNDASDSDVHFLGFTGLFTLISGEQDITLDCGMYSGAKRIIPPPYIDKQGIEYITNTTRIFINFTDGSLTKTFFRLWKWDTETDDWHLLFDWITADEGLHHDPPLYPLNLCTIGNSFAVGCCGYYELEYYYDNLTVMYYNNLYVDCTPPVTTKTYGIPSRPDLDDPTHTHWITPVTPIHLAAHDETYGSGLHSIWYRVYYPNNTLYTIPMNGTWTRYRENFTITGQEGVYHIEYYSKDNVGNQEIPVSQTAILGCPWDLNHDGTVNILDIIRIVNHFGETGDPWWISEDLAGAGPQNLPDGTINILDIISAANHWGNCPPPSP